MGVAAVCVCISLTASNDCVTACWVDARTVASTRALMAAASMIGVDVDADGVPAVVESKKALSEAVGDGEGVRPALFRIRACGDGYLKLAGS